MATVSISGYEQGSPTLYNVIVSFEGQSQQIQKRYSEFVLLAREVEQETGVPVPVGPPAKGGIFGSVDLEERRRGLEAMIRALTRSDECCATLAVQDFLEISRLKRSKPEMATSAQWVAAMTQVNELLAQAKKADTIRCHKLCLAAQSLTATMQKQLNQQEALGTRERIRRQHILDECHQKISALRSDGVSAGIDGTNASVERRSSAPGKTVHPTEKRSGRVLGETHLTRTLDNQQLLMHQKRSVEDQDAAVQQLRDAICRQRELGLAINDEILKQNSMLDDLDADVYRVNNKLNQAQRKTSKFL